jgi:membrane-associated phospholipid phosphatase
MPEASPQVTGPEDIPRPKPLFEAAILASLGAAALALFLFAWLGNEMLEGDTRHFDQAVREWVHRYASPGMTSAMTAISLLGYNLLIVELVIALAIFAKLKWRRAAVWLTVAMTGSLVLDLVLKYIYHRARPTAYFGMAPHSYSFPSGHALCSFCFYGVLAGLLSARAKPLAWKLLIWIAATTLVTAIGLSRIYLGVHYPSDVVAGYLAAAVWVGTIIVLDHVRTVRMGSKKRTA